MKKNISQKKNIYSECLSLVVEYNEELRGDEPLVIDCIGTASETTGGNCTVNFPFSGPSINT
ncbi:hypothetical protein DERP_003657 [Dermatophagoides pteronyssinus]|uniref:Uncharacterized protein n=1 Tax=Dermatophagoides pteronyssinus TaxID=6956 RepID=A0ABQ8JLU4_DERPT|nr:hypothetical protein DERP_003657 [Dermatophagoides pteronyssinus]